MTEELANTFSRSGSSLKPIYIIIIEEKIQDLHLQNMKILKMLKLQQLIMMKVNYLQNCQSQTYQNLFGILKIGKKKIEDYTYKERVRGEKQKMRDDEEKKKEEEKAKEIIKEIVNWKIVFQIMNFILMLNALNLKEIFKISKSKTFIVIFISIIKEWHI